MTVSPDGSRLAGIGGDGSLLLLWNLGTRQQISPPLQAGQLRGPPGYLGDGQQLVTSGAAGLMSWDLRPESWRTIACRLAGRNLTDEEWSTFLPGEPYRMTC